MTFQWVRGVADATRRSGDRDPSLLITWGIDHSAISLFLKFSKQLCTSYVLKNYGGRKPRSKNLGISGFVGHGVDPPPLPHTHTRKSVTTPLIGVCALRAEAVSKFKDHANLGLSFFPMMTKRLFQRSRLLKVKKSSEDIQGHLKYEVTKVKYFCR